MKNCPACQTVNADTDNACKQCGLPLVQPGGSDTAGSTVRWTAPLQVPLQQGAGALISLNTLFAAKQRLIVGRAVDCDVCLPHPLVSRYHALLEQNPEGALTLSDLGSVNGVWVAGNRVQEPVVIEEGERVGIGPFLFTLRNGVIHSVDSSRSLRLEARHLEKVVPLPGGQTRRLLDDINLAINPGEFVCLLGPSGSGKSTLMDALNGRRRATGGKVLANGEDFYRHFDNFRTSLGYVPQKDIVHTGLSVYRALYYTARLRLPTDTSPEEIQERIEEVIEEMELDPHRQTLVANLSGGQIKRVSLGAELLAQPCVLYIDEATSGLDAGTEARMMRLFRGLADEGRSIICITHNIDNVAQSHLILVLARGKVMYYGPPGDAPTYFKVSRISEIYDRLTDKDLAEWEQRYRSCEFYQEFVAKRLATPSSSYPALPTPRLHPSSTHLKAAEKTPASRGRQPPESSPPEKTPASRGRQPPESSPPEKTPASRGRQPPESSPPPDSAKTPGANAPGSPPPGADAPGSPPLADRLRQLTSQAIRLREWLNPIRLAWSQFRVLTSRYTDLTLGDRRGLRLLLLQAPIVAVFLLLGFLDKKFQSPMPVPRKLTESETNILQALDALNTMVNDSKEPGGDNAKALDQIKIEIPGEKGAQNVTGSQLIRVLRMMGKLPDKPDPKTLRSLESARVSFKEGDKTVTVSMAELTQTFKYLHESKLIGQLKDYKGPLIPAGEMTNPRYTYMLLFILAVIVLWFGCNNAAKEIVKEEAIYGRERAVNLGILPYLASKFLVLGLITIFHAFLLMLVVYGTLNVLHAIDPARFSVPLIGTSGTAGQMLSYPAQFGVLAILALTGVALGLLLSACVATPDRANALLPYVLIPQLILGGGFLPVGSGVLYYLATTLSPVYWAYRAIHLGANRLPEGFPGRVPYEDNAAIPCEALLIQTVVLLVLTAWFLRRKDA